MSIIKQYKWVVVITCLVYTITSFACQNALAVSKSALSKRVISELIPDKYGRSDFDVVYGNSNGKPFALVCAYPLHMPQSTLEPPYIKLFLMASVNSKPRILWSQEVVPDNICMEMKIIPAGKQGCVISVVSRPYGGSVYCYDLRLYKYRGNANPPVLIRTVEYVDGVTTALTSRNAKMPAFLVYDPIYGDFKFNQCHYRFRLYKPLKNGRYTLNRVLKTRHKYVDAHLAYKEIKETLRKYVGSKYNLPASVLSEKEFEDRAL